MFEIGEVTARAIENAPKESVNLGDWMFTIRNERPLLRANCNVHLRLGSTTDAVNRLGNHVILRCGEAEIIFAHMRNSSVSVAPGDELAVSDPLGAVGNSGASTEPHLHIHAQRPAPEAAPPISGEPLALRIDGQFLVRGNRLTGSDR